MSRSKSAASSPKSGKRGKFNPFLLVNRLEEQLNPINFLKQLNPRQIKITKFSLVGFLMVVLAYHFTLSPEGFIARNDLSRQVEISKSENEQLSLKIKGLQGEIEKLKGNMGYIEMVARNELGLARPGESIYKYRDQQ